MSSPGTNRIAECRLTDWLIGQGPAAADVGALLAELGERLNAEGVPLARSTTHVLTLHPQFRGVMRLWKRGQGTREIRPEHGSDIAPSYHGSPLEFVRKTGRWLERRLEPGSENDFPMFAELMAEGLTHYVMAPLPFADGTTNAVSWASDHRDGFEPSHMALLRAIVPAFSAILQLKAIQRVSAELLRVYVGAEPAERILRGSVRRGDTARITAAILMSDLRGYTRWTEALPESDVIALLNDYYDCVLPPVRERGGEILKFIGDGVLAIFEDTRAGSPAAACAAALAAAEDVHRLLLELARSREKAHQAPLAGGIALHRGQLIYGNVGSGDRLDFTVIGRDVNLTSRIERLCGPLERRVLMSEAFANAVPSPCFELGSFTLKGLAEPIRLFTAEDGGLAT
ncbi:MAG: adenylate/guanylate cyclase domain-containing protein [Alphaproteobacteria bacterium]